nr:DsrE family protein [Burkholderia multivorans]
MEPAVTPDSSTTETGSGPSIARFGAAHAVDGAAHLPDPAAHYRLVFSISSAGRQKDMPNPSLNRVARAVNLFRMSGVPAAHLHFVAVVHGDATSVVLDDAWHQAYDGTPNPSVDLIAALCEANVEVTVCAQALIANQFAPEWVMPAVTHSLSALTTLAVLQADGYSLIPL